MTLEGALGLAEPLKGSVYLARPYQNPFTALIALYLVARSARRGPDPQIGRQARPRPPHGRLIATFESLPRLLYTHFSLTLREGQRSTLVSPPTCGPYASDIGARLLGRTDASSTRPRAPS